jgi:hypothetical protein
VGGLQRLVENIETSRAHGRSPESANACQPTRGVFRCSEGSLPKKRDDAAPRRPIPAAALCLRMPHDRPGVSPNHPRFHRFRTVGRLCGMDSAKLDAIQGYAQANEGASYGEFPAASLKPEIDKLPRYDVVAVETTNRRKTRHKKEQIAILHRKRQIPLDASLDPIDVHLEDGIPLPSAAPDFNALVCAGDVVEGPGQKRRGSGS